MKKREIWCRSHLIELVTAPTSCLRMGALRRCWTWFWRKKFLSVSCDSWWLLFAAHNGMRSLSGSELFAELCLTSNVKCKTVKDYASHHSKFWFTQNHPLIICVSNFTEYLLRPHDWQVSFWKTSEINVSRRLTESYLLENSAEKR